MHSFSTDVAIVGAGVLGTFHAYFACQRGLHATLIERNHLPLDASVRNFGMIIPSGMPPGPWRQRALASAALYRQLAEEVPFFLQQTGTQYLATTPGEKAVLEEFARIGPEQGYSCRLLDSQDSIAVNPAIHPDHCLASLHFIEDLRLNPREMLARVLPWLTETHSCDYLPRTQAIRVEREGAGCKVSTAAGETILAGQVIICSGADLHTLYPDRFEQGGVQSCKLHMLRLHPPGSSLPTSLASGLSLRHYPSFRLCSSWARLQEEPVDPELSSRGIHLLLVQDPDGSVVVGDSHEYLSHTPNAFLDAHTEQLILAHAEYLVRFASWQVAERWHGIYTTHPHQDLFHEVVDERIHLVTGIGGKGMSTGPGLAKEIIEGLR